MPVTSVLKAAPNELGQIGCHEPAEGTSEKVHDEKTRSFRVRIDVVQGSPDYST
jgi:hypothetical protein